MMMNAMTVYRRIEKRFSLESTSTVKLPPTLVVAQSPDKQQSDQLQMQIYHLPCKDAMEEFKRWMNGGCQLTNIDKGPSMSPPKIKYLTYVPSLANVA